MGPSSHYLSPLGGDTGTPHPFLCCASLVLCSPLFSSRLAPLDRVIRHCAIASFELLCTVPHAASQMIARFLPTDLQLRQRVMEYQLRRLSYGDELDLSGPSIMTRNQIIGPLDILRQEIDICIDLSQSMLLFSIRLRLITFGRPTFSYVLAFCALHS